MGTIEDLNSLQLSGSDPVEMENRGKPEAGAGVASCQNQEEPATQSNCPPLCSKTCSANDLNDMGTSHPPGTSANVAGCVSAEADKPSKTPGQALDLNQERGQEESSDNFGDSTAGVNAEVDQNRNATTKLDLDSSDPNIEVPLEGRGQETRRTETDHCSDLQQPSDLSETPTTNVDSTVQPDRNVTENDQQSEVEDKDLGTVVCYSQISASASTSQDAEVQVAIQVQSRSVATSPMAPLDNCPVFKIPDVSLRGQPVEKPTACPSDMPSVTAPPKKDVEMQVDITVQCKSVATGPMTPLEKTPLSTLPEVGVEAMEEEQPEPVREVQWDEKGMTWEVYGASMDAEVLGLAIQKHLEKQIEEHGKQNIEVYQNDKSSSLKGSLRKEENKRRQSNVFQAVLHNIRSPQCCIRGSTAAE